MESSAAILAITILVKQLKQVISLSKIIRAVKVLHRDSKCTSSRKDVYKMQLQGIDCIVFSGVSFSFSSSYAFCCLLSFPFLLLFLFYFVFALFFVVAFCLFLFCFLLLLFVCLFVVVFGGCFSCFVFVYLFVCLFSCLLFFPDQEKNSFIVKNPNVIKFRREKNRKCLFMF